MGIKGEGARGRSGRPIMNHECFTWFIVVIGSSRFRERGREGRGSEDTETGAEGTGRGTEGKRGGGEGRMLQKGVLEERAWGEEKRGARRGHGVRGDEGMG